VIDWFEPTADNYFNHVKRTTIELAVAEAKGKEAELSVRAAKKKGEAVLIAERLVSGSGGRDNAVDELAKKVQKITNAPSKTEAVRRALQNELKRAKDSIPLRDRVKVIQDQFAAILGPNPEPFDMKKFSDELYEDD